jgi:hypothetical protein
MDNRNSVNFVNSVDLSKFGNEYLLILRNKVNSELDKRLQENSSMVFKIKSLLTPSKTCYDDITITNVYGKGDDYFDKKGKYIGKEHNNITIITEIPELLTYETIVDKITDYGQVNWIVSIKHKNSVFQTIFVNFVDNSVAKLINETGLHLY